MDRIRIKCGQTFKLVLAECKLKWQTPTHVHNIGLKYVTWAVSESHGSMHNSCTNMVFPADPVVTVLICLCMCMVHMGRRVPQAFCHPPVCA